VSSSIGQLAPLLASQPRRDRPVRGWATLGSTRGTAPPLV